MSELYNIKGFDLTSDGLEVHVSMKVTSARLKKAHRNLKVNIMNGMLPFMPIRIGDLTRKTRAANTVMLDDEIMYAAAGSEAGGVPYGNFHYRGMVMVDPLTGSPFARKHAKKVATDRPLTWSNPNAAPYWFDVAKKRYLKQWVELAQEDLEGG